MCVFCSQPTKFWCNVMAADGVFPIESCPRCALIHMMHPPCSGRAERCCARCRRSRSCTWRACCFLPPQCPKVQLAAAKMVLGPFAARRLPICRLSWL